VAKYCDEHVCVSVFVCESVYLRGYLLNQMRDLYQIFVHVAYGRGSVLFWLGDKIPGEGAILGFFPIDDALYSIAFGTHTKMAEPIELPLGTMTLVVPRYHVLDVGPNPSRGKGNFGGKHSRGKLYGELCKNG